MLEDAEVDWDVADIQKVQQRARNMTGLEPYIVCIGKPPPCRIISAVFLYNLRRCT